VNGPFDMAVTALPFEDTRVESELFATVRTFLIMPKRHPLAAKRVVQLKDLRGEAIVMPTSGTSTRASFDVAFESVGLKLDGMIEAASAFFVCQLVARGLGLGLVDPFTFKWASGLGLVARPTRPAIELRLGFLFPSHRPRSALVSAFVLAVRSTVSSRSS
jgi:DNA-binding transcriptional LysR family regulator